MLAGLEIWLILRIIIAIEAFFALGMLSFALPYHYHICKKTQNNADKARFYMYIAMFLLALSAVLGPFFILTNIFTPGLIIQPIAYAIIIAFTGKVMVQEVQFNALQANQRGLKLPQTD